MKKYNKKYIMTADGKKITVADIPELEKKYDNAYKEIFNDGNCFSSWNEKEIDYLLSGHATEVVESITVQRKPEWTPYDKFENQPQGIIYGVIAAERSAGRYVWIYLKHSSKFFRCNNINSAYEKAKKLIAYHEICDQIEFLEDIKYAEDKKRKMQRKKSVAKVKIPNQENKKNKLKKAA